MLGYALAALLGAALVLLLDPERGRSRRAVTRDRVGGLLRRGARMGQRAARASASSAYGRARRAARARTDESALDDATLTQRVMSELFRDKRIPKGRINVNAENGIVLIRGEIEDPGLIVEIIERARRIDGVADVENLLHLPGEPAPRR
jgi:osmotically-inducible protein OsmY